MKQDLDVNYDLIVKIVILGDTSVGKTNLVHRYLFNEFDE